MSDDLLESMGYVLVRIEEGKSESIFSQLNEEGFSFVNIDVDGDNVPFALFVRDKFTKRQIIEWFVIYTITVKGFFRNTTKQFEVLIPNTVHPIEFINNLNKESIKSKQVTSLVFFKEVYQKLSKVGNLRLFL